MEIKISKRNSSSLIGAKNSIFKLHQNFIIFWFALGVTRQTISSLYEDTRVGQKVCNLLSFPPFIIKNNTGTINIIRQLTTIKLKQAASLNSCLTSIILSKKK